MRTEDYERIEKAIRYIEANFRGQPDLEETARAVGLSEHHFHRLFRRFAGITPKRFLRFLTAEHARELLARSANVMDAAWESGLSGPGRLHDLTVDVYGATPGEVRGEGAGLEIRYGVHPSPFGACFVAYTRRGVCRLSFLPAGRDGDDALGELRLRWPRAALLSDPEGSRRMAARIFAPARRRGESPLRVLVRGTNFQIKVWEALLRIPEGCAVAYEDVARWIGAPKAVRAVGSAVGANPVAFLIPCHRVLRKSGAFGEYGGGAARKKAILAWEAAGKK
jgi:AraC family transcriptional regulator of adaptative response/methylated-DNA-[protein]-cysteine methyltransferase